MTRDNPAPDEAPFALLLTHDIDRPYKTYQSLYYALTGDESASRRHHLSTLRPGENPYWQFDSLMAIEDDLGVRSACNFLYEQSLFRDRPVADWLRKECWMRYAGRYRFDDPGISDAINALDDAGWEIGLHGSYDSYTDRDRLRWEKARLEDVLGHPVVGTRQHHLNLEIPETWEHHRSLGLCYDTSLGSSTECGFQYGYDPKRPFDDEFVVFPLTVMDNALPTSPADGDRAWERCAGLLDEARENDAVMSVLWHLRSFSDAEFPGRIRVYERLVEEAIDAGAWVGSPWAYYRDAELGSCSEPRERTVTGG